MKIDLYLHDADTCQLDRIERKIDAMANTLQDLDQGLTDFEAAADAADAADAAAEQEILAAVKDIQSKIGPGVDLAPELARIQAAQQKRAAASAGLRTATDAVKAIDVPPTPAPGPAPGP